MSSKATRLFPVPAFAALALWPVLMFLLYSVYIRIQSKYFAALLSSSGLDGQTSLNNVLFLYRYDLLLFGVLAPLVLMACFALLRRGQAVAIWALVIVVSQALLYMNLQSWGQVGRFMNWPALVNAISFGLSNPNFVGEYIALDGLLKLAVLLLSSVAVFAAAHFLGPRSLLLRVGASLSLLGVLVAFVLLALGLTSRMQPAPITNSFYVSAVLSLTGQDEAAQALPITEAELDVKFKALAQSGLDDFRGKNFGVEEGSNLLLFVLETGSIEFLDVRKGLPKHPLLERLKPKLFSAQNHFSTFPASAESNLSILAGFYPPRALYATCLTDADSAGRTIPGFVPALRQRGYQTSLYAPFKSQVPADRLVFERTGFERTFYGQDHNPEKSQGSDRRTLQELSADIQTWTSKGQRFAAAFFPQIGHGPWGPEHGPTIQKRGERLAMEQLNWVDGLVKQLEQAGQLERTVIVITGDHGVRTALEDPKVRVGMIDHYSLHVPLLIYAPRANYADVDPKLPSSHVDLAAELSQLFGVPRGRVFQGLSLHHPDRRTRRQFFMAGWYYGANGYRDSQEAAMHSTTLDATYVRSDGEVNFSSRDLVRDRKLGGRVNDAVTQMLDLQESWISQRVCKAP